MAVKRILSLFESAHILKTKSEPVRMSDPDLPSVLQDLKDTLDHTENGVGLAAVQIGVLKRIFALKRSLVEDDLNPDSSLAKSHDEILVFINPKIIARKGTVVDEEGCLSVPGHYATIERAKVVKVRALDEHGQQIYERYEGLAARAVQQEIDHLDGILIIDHQK